MILFNSVLTEKNVMMSNKCLVRVVLINYFGCTFSLIILNPFFKLISRGHDFLCHFWKWNKLKVGRLWLFPSVFLTINYIYLYTTLNNLLIFFHTKRNFHYLVKRVLYIYPIYLIQKKFKLLDIRCLTLFSVSVQWSVKLPHHTNVSWKAYKLQRVWCHWIIFYKTHRKLWFKVSTEKLSLISRW